MGDPRFSVASCQSCGGHIEFPAEGAGMEVECPHCSAGTTLMEELPAVPKPVADITAAELKEALSQQAPRRPISVFYQFGMLLVALFMILLPVAYLVFIAGAAYGSYWYGVHSKVMLTSFTGGGRLYIIKLFLYLTPLLAGGIAVFFMFKPILAPRPKHSEPIELNPALQPRLYQLIAHLTEVLRVPMPKRVYLNCDLNACVGFRRGLLSFFGNDL